MSANGTPKLNTTLLQLHETGGGGIVRAEWGKVKKQIVLRSGHVAFAESNQPEEHLVRMMVKANALPRLAVPIIADRMKSGKSVDEAILAGTDVDPGVLRQSASDQAVTVVASVLDCEQVTIRYFGCEDLIRRNFDLEMAVPALLVAAARRAAARRSATAHLPGVVSMVEGSRVLLSEIPLEPAEAYGCSLAERPIPVQEFLQLLPEGDTSPHEILRRLVLLGFVNVKAERAPSDNVAEQESEACAAAQQLEEMERRFEVANHYEILSVATDAADGDIKNAYHLLAKRHHPDLFQSDRFSPTLRRAAERVFTYVTAAYRTLSDPVSRAVYDEQRRTTDSQVEAALQARAGVDLDKDKTARALFRVGRDALRDKDYEKAAMTLSECVFLRPDVARYQLLLGVVQSELPKFRKDAEQHLLKAIELDPMNIESRLALGALYLKVKLPRRAEAQYMQVLRWDARNTEAQRRLSELK